MKHDGAPLHLVRIQPTIAGLRAGVDEVLERALEMGQTREPPIPAEDVSAASTPLSLSVLTRSRLGRRIAPSLLALVTPARTLAPFNTAPTSVIYKNR